MANLLPIGNQLVIFTLVPLSGDVRLLGAIHHPFGLNCSLAGRGEGSDCPGNDEVEACFTIYIWFLNNTLPNEVSKIMTQLGHAETVEALGLNA